MLKNIHRGFTLIELLVVVAIITLLVSIALPNYLEAMTRAKVAQAKAEMRSLSTALEMYKTDFRAYPQSAAMFPPMRLRPLTTPVAYVQALPQDPFDDGGRFRMYSYGAMDLDLADRYILASQAPDRSRDSDPLEFYPGYRAGLFLGPTILIIDGEPKQFDYLLYSPTNGTISKGDLLTASDYQR